MSKEKAVEFKWQRLTYDDSSDTCVALIKGGALVRCREWDNGNQAVSVVHIPGATAETFGLQTPEPQPTFLKGDEVEVLEPIDSLIAPPGTRGRVVAVDGAIVTVKLASWFIDRREECLRLVSRPDSCG